MLSFITFSSLIRPSLDLDPNGVHHASFHPTPPPPMPYDLYMLRSMIIIMSCLMMDRNPLAIPHIMHVPKSVGLDSANPFS